jgi:hypothetical protein
LSDRAPDGQPTENIRLVLKNTRTELNNWERSLVAAEASVIKYREIVDRRSEEVRRWERYLAIRLSEEATKVEVNGL